MESLNGILAFVKTAESLSFVSAARAMGISASAVGKNVARLESSLKVRLFQRSTRKVSLTAEGQLFYERCRRILDDLQDAEAMLSHAIQAPRGRLRVSLPTIGYRFLLPLMPGTRKAAIVLISDGLDRGSKAAFDKTLGDLQNHNVTLYTLEIPDRTNGAYRRNQPKAREVLKQLVEGTGGRAFSFDEPQTAAKAICDELRNNRYLLSYFPTNTSSYDARRVFLMGQEGITIRTKSAQPPNIK